MSVGAGNNSDGDGDGFPSIRKLPLLAVKYSDLYRNVKVEEAVFETLTKQYEIAKIQEAKDTPSLNVLDDADVPEWKLRPQRGLFAALGTLLAALPASLYILGGDRWHAGRGHLRPEVVGGASGVRRSCRGLLPRTRTESRRSEIRPLVLSDPPAPPSKSNSKRTPNRATNPSLSGCPDPFRRSRRVGLFVLNLRTAFNSAP